MILTFISVACLLKSLMSWILLTSLTLLIFCQAVTGPTQTKVHTLELVISCGLSISNLVLDNAYFSDHSPVIFEIPVSLKSAVQHETKWWRRTFQSCTAAQFGVEFSRAAECFKKIVLILTFCLIQFTPG